MISKVIKRIKKTLMITAIVATTLGGVTGTNVMLALAEPETPTAQAAQSTQIVEIRTVDELKKAAASSTGSYKLMADLDMTGVEWTPWDFSGTFDGNGYSILNLNVKTLGTSTLKTYDGNRKVYDTYGAGFFGTVNNSTIKDLSLYGERVEITTDKHAFAAPIAGVAENSTITNCTINNAYISLTDSAIMWGCGGIVGYGSGKLDKIETTVTLVCVDTDKVTKDEQFLGGAYAAGYLDITNCTVNIEGYDSDHGYVHNGGLVGMYIVYPIENVATYAGQIVNNKVYGQITFFEDNVDRRAYCKDSVGEVMNWTYSYSGFVSDFKSNETKDYSVDLKPEKCATPAYTDTVTAPTDKAYGFTTHTCQGCGYSYSDKYVIHEHKADMKVIDSNTVGNETNELLSGICSLCNKNVYEFKTTIVEPSKEEAKEDGTNNTDKKTNSNKTIITVLIVIGVVLLITFIALVSLIIRENARRKRRRRRKKAVNRDGRL